MVEKCGDRVLRLARHEKTTDRPYKRLLKELKENTMRATNHMNGSITSS